MFNIIRVRQHERAIWFRHGDFKRLLAPGAYFMPSRLILPFRDRVEKFDTLKTYFTHPLLDVLLQEPTVRDALHVVELTDDERALV